jgi:hypothetical protein
MSFLHNNTTNCTNLERPSFDQKLLEKLPPNKIRETFEFGVSPY